MNDKIIETFGKKISDKVYDWYIRKSDSRPKENIYGPYYQLITVDNVIVVELFTNNYPSYGRLAKDGYLPKIDPVGFDASIHKLILESFTDNGINVWQDYENKTTQDFDDMSVSKLAMLEIEVTNLANEKISGHIDAVEVSHWLGVSEAYARQHALWLEEFTMADKEQRPPDEVNYPPLTLEDHQVWFSLSLIQSSTSPVRGAARAIIASLYQMTSDEVNALPEDWVSSHGLWP